MASEEVLFFSENVKYKKNNGKLKLLSDKILWTADGAEKPRLSYSYSDIKGKILSKPRHKSNKIHVKNNKNWKLCKTTYSLQYKHHCMK